jgi:hypothetical protein
MTPDRPSGEDPLARPTGSRGATGRKSWLVAGSVLLVAALVAVWAFSERRSAARALERTETALQLQVLASRFGMAAFEAEYGDFETARRFASQAFDGIANYGIERGALRQDYADVLATRDDIIAMLATRQAPVAERLMTLFFDLQIPVETELDPSRILPAADSGLGLDPPRRNVLPAGSADSALRRDTLPGPPGGR